MVVEELVAKLGLELDPEVFKVLEEFHHAIHHGIGIAVAAAAGAFAALVGETAEAAVQLGHAADVLGVNVERLGELKFAADRSELSFEGLTMGLKHLGQGAAEAAAGSKEMAKAFSGIRLREADGQIRPVNDLLEGVAEKFHKLPTAAQKLDLAMKVFGRAGAEMIPFLKNLEEGIEHAREFGTVFSEEDVEGGRVFIEGLKDIRDALTGLRNAFATKFFESFGHGMAAISHGIVSLRPLVSGFAKELLDAGSRLGGVLSKVLGLGVAFGSWLTHLSVVRGFIDAFAQWFKNSKVLEAAMIGLGVVLGVLAARSAASAAITIGSWLLAAAPFILLAALIGFIVDDINVFLDGGDSMIGRIEKWSHVIDPEDNPLTKFLRDSLALLFDLGSPQRWNRVKDSALDAFSVLATGKSRAQRQEEAGAINVPAGTALTQQADDAGNYGSGLSGWLRRKMSLGNVPRFDPPAAASGGGAGGFSPDWRGGGVTLNYHGMPSMTPEEAQTMVDRTLGDFVSKAAPGVSGGPQ